MNDTDTVVRNALLTNGLPIRSCGLNADWCVSAWHVGPGDMPNDNARAQLYVIDNEDGTIAAGWRHDGHDDFFFGEADVACPDEVNDLFCAIIDSF